MPSNIARPHGERSSPQEPVRIEPISGYTLALIWMPQHCFRAVPGAESLGCETKSDAVFKLHGLWPDGRNGSWPQWCAATPILSRRIIAANYRRTPSAQLLQHEWAKHGVCIPGMTAARYFARSGRQFDVLQYPDMKGLARRRITARDFAFAFAAANRGMTAEMMKVSLDADGWLREIWLCFDIALKRTACTAPMLDDRLVRIRIQS